MAATAYDAIVLDVMLPGIDGFEVLTRLRGRQVWTPVVMLTARDTVPGRVTGLDRGADAELIELSAREHTLLEFLLRHRDQVLSRATLIERVWGYPYDGHSNVVDVYVKSLQDKIDHPHGLVLIRTIRGAGYRLACPEL